MIAKGLQVAGATCYVHNGIIGSAYVNADEVKTDEGVEITTYTASSNGYSNFFWHPIKNLPKLWKYLKSHRDKKDRNIVVVEIPKYHVFILYSIICRALGYRIACIAHEWIPTLKRPGLIDRFYNDPLYTKTFGYCVHAILPVSEYIISKCNRFGKPYFKLPALADFSEIIAPSETKSTYFLYCVRAGYFRVIKIIVDAFSIYKKQGGRYSLKLILSGPEASIEKVRQYTRTQNVEENVTIETKLPYEVLLDRYRKASALLIPLDPNYEQDFARFPQKIAEYTSSAVPIIATNVGEVKFYFTDENCIKVDFTEESFADAFSWVENNPAKANEIGRNGYSLGLEKFNCMTVCTNLMDFFRKI